jgi:hypothetical protein
LCGGASEDRLFRLILIVIVGRQLIILFPILLVGRIQSLMQFGHQLFDLYRTFEQACLLSVSRFSGG